MVLRGPTGSALEAPSVSKTAIDEVEVDLCSFALNPAQLVERAGPRGASLQLRQLAHIGYAFAVNKGARVPDLGPNNPLGNSQALLFRKSVLAAAHFSDGVPLRDEAAPVSAVLGEVVKHYSVFVCLGYEGRGEVDVAEDVYGIDLAHWEGGDLSLTFHENDYPAAIHAHLGALLSDVNHAVVKDAFARFHSNPFAFAPSRISVSRGMQYWTVLHFSHLFLFAVKSGILSRRIFRIASVISMTFSLCQSVMVMA